MGTGVLTAIMLMDQIYKFVPFLKATGLEMAPLIWMVVYSVPTILMLSMPISLMIGTYVGIHRLGQDSEITAMRAAGVSLSYLFRPVMALAFLVGLITTWLVMWASPWGVRSLEELKFEILKRQTKINLTVGKINNFFGQKSIYIFEQEGDLLKGVFIADWEDPEGKSMIEAQTGRIHFEESEKRIYLLLYNGRIHQLGEEENHRLIQFAQLDYNLSPPNRDRSNLPARYRDPSKGPQLNDMQMSVGRLRSEIERAKAGSKDQFEYIDEFHGRIATILSCLVFGIFALPMGIHDPRNPKSMRFVYMILMMILYYALYSQGRAQVSQGKGSIFMIYFPLLLALAIGLVNYFKINYDFGSLKEWVGHRFKQKKETP